MAEQTKSVPAGDVIMYEGPNQAFTRESKAVTNSGDATITLLAGYPMDDNVPVLAATIANTDGIVAVETDIEAGETVKVPVIVRGNIIINKAKLPATDIAGDTLTNATLAAKLATLTGFVVRDEPDQTLEQTT